MSRALPRAHSMIPVWIRSWEHMTQATCRSYSLVPARKPQLTFQLWILWGGFGCLVLQCPSNIAALLEGSWTQRGEPLAAALLHSKGCVWKTAGANPGSSGLRMQGEQAITQLLEAKVATLLPMSFMPRAATSCHGSRPCKVIPKVFWKELVSRWRWGGAEKEVTLLVPVS